MTRFATIVATALLGAMTAGDAAADEGDSRGDAAAHAARLRQKIHRVVPKGWSVRASGSRVVASREVVVTDVTNPPPDFEPVPTTTRDYEIVLTLGARMTQAEVDRRRARNQRLRRKIARLERTMRAFACDGLDRAYRDDCYRPRTRAQRALVARHRNLRGKLRPLPAYYVGDLVSVTVRTDSVAWYEEVDCDDCERVEARIAALLTPYAAPTKP